MKIYLALAPRNDIVAAIRAHYPVGRLAMGGKHTILLIDPSPTVTKFLRVPLEREGYGVLAAEDGIEGLKLVFSRHPDLILCDLMMPRLDGYSFMDALKAHPETSDIPIILLSAKTSGEEEHRALKAGFADFIGKPAMPIRVLVKIKRALALAASDKQGAPFDDLPLAANMSRSRRSLAGRF